MVGWHSGGPVRPRRDRSSMRSPRQRSYCAAKQAPARVPSSGPRDPRRPDPCCLPHRAPGVAARRRSGVDDRLGHGHEGAIRDDGLDPRRADDVRASERVVRSMRSVRVALAMDVTEGVHLIRAREARRDRVFCAPDRWPPSARSGRSPVGIAVGVRSGGYTHPSPSGKPSPDRWPNTSPSFRIAGEALLADEPRASDAASRPRPIWWRARHPRG